MCMIACRPYIKTICEIYDCHFVDKIISKLYKEKVKYKRFFESFFEYSLNTSIAVKKGDNKLVDHISRYISRKK